MERVAWIIGNGPSRKQVDLDELEGTTFGCNAIYRDFTPDYLISGDAGVIKEICVDGYPRENNCIFPDWSPVPLDFRDIIVEPLREQGFSIEETNPNNHKYVQIFGNEHEGSRQVHVIGCDPLWKIQNMRGTESDNEFGVNFFCGSQAMLQASILGFDEIGLLGFDSIWSFKTDTYQNIYAGTQNYMREKETSRLRVGTDDPNSMSGTQEAQIKKVLDQFPDISYNIYKGLKKYPLTYDSFK
tara:strand:+ start:998 stop:1723 length:726 start_codon:yes stop_codon:yes gene_type:complete